MKTSVAPWFRLRSRGPADWALAGEALVLTGWIALQGWLGLTEESREERGTAEAETLPIATAAEQAVIARVAWAVAAVRRALRGWGGSGVQARVARRLLIARAVPSTLYVVRPTARPAVPPPVETVWLRAGPTIVTGQLPSVAAAEVRCSAQWQPRPFALRQWSGGLLVGVLAAGLVYVSLAPQPPLRSLGSEHWSGPWRAWWHRWGQMDFLQNLLGFAGLNLGVHGALFGLRRASWRYRLRSLGLVVATAWMLEILQFFLPERHCSLMDMAAALLAIAGTTWPWIAWRPANPPEPSGEAER